MLKGQMSNKHILFIGIDLFHAYGCTMLWVVETFWTNNVQMLICG